MLPNVHPPTQNQPTNGYGWALAEGILADNPHLVLLFYLSQLFLRELIKSHRLVQVIPMDMSGYYENRAGPSNLGNVISQILLCKQITPDFNQEELCSITKDSQEIARILQDLQEFMPQQETYLERTIALTAEINGPWPAKRRRGSLYKNMGLLCCVSRPNYL
ncbi:AAEL002220-PA [Aedes aegypti]|uniref:AAEL002220-PA n=1 Tax=Aedes aegypti TaxID=7159 RepID=Q17J06_AEDAE|nr:AAEL002220-PA [Aedes aegypti]